MLTIIIFIHIYFSMHHFVVKFSGMLKLQQMIKWDVFWDTV